MRSIAYERYLDKVYGCFLGKCIGGTAGGPAEGRKELLDYPLYEPLLHQTLPNDDLDLQILWLEVLEEKGIYCTERDLAEAFYQKVPYGPGEYGYFKKNYGRGIYPPLSGRYNNRYYINGMGCPIRSEIWACLLPGDVDSARSYIYMDGCMDHAGDSIEAELFLAAVESEAFFEDDLRRLFAYGLSKMQPDTKIYHVLCDTLRWYDEGLDWKKTRGRILREYGHADCTNLYQNMGFILLTLLYGGCDFREIVRLGLACGYDTDCICASAASIAGTIFGGKRLLTEFGMTDTGLSIAVGTRRKDGSILSLAKDVCVAGMTMTEALHSATSITEQPPYTPISCEKRKEVLTFAAEYDGNPVVAPGKTTAWTLCITNHTENSVSCACTLQALAEILLSCVEAQITIPAGETYRLPLTASVSPDARMLHQKNLVTVTAKGAFGECTDVFGLVGADVWKHYGPFLANIRDLRDVPPHEGYGAYLQPAAGEDGMDLLRHYHLSHVARITDAFVEEAEPFTEIVTDERAETEPVLLAPEEDYFDIADLAPFEGPHVGYLVRTVYSEVACDVTLVLGRTAPYALWLNGKKLGQAEDAAWWTCENHHFDVHFQAGENTIILKYAMPADHAGYSLMFRLPDGGMRQYEDFPTVLS